MRSIVEQIMMERSGMELRYGPAEKIGVIVVPSFPELGTFTALRFLEWVQQNPGGVISLPTGKTPEYFIKNVMRFLKNWNSVEAQKELEENGVDPAKKPDMKNLVYVQIDEFYPISPLQHNSFYYYVNKYYIDGFGLDPGKALLINCEQIGLPEGKNLDEIWPHGEVDLTLRYRHPSSNLERTQKTVLEKIDQWCTDRENKIRDLGGIGFFLGGIGPDGHIGFNIRGSDLFSTTRLVPTNYETQASAAQDLGGIEIARKRLVITIGLSTITFNPECVAVIIAAGEAKAEIVSASIRSPRHIHFPATVLHTLPNARFYLTSGAAKLLHERNIHHLQYTESLTDAQVEEIIVDLSIRNKVSVERLSIDDFKNDQYGKLILGRGKKYMEASKSSVIKSLKQKIENGIFLNENSVFLHTEPHHDDIMLGYLPGVVRHIRIRSNRHYFATFTSGFTAVTNFFMLDQLTKLKDYIKDTAFGEMYEDGYFSPVNIIGKNRDVWQYLDGVAARSRTMMEEGRLRRLLRNLIDLYDETDIDLLENRVDELINYFKTQYPGRKDLPHIQRLKGMCREWEADCLWGYFGWHSDSVLHLRLGFYKGETFTQEPEIDRDVLPVVEMLKKIRPDIITVALDPEASGPDTHYKALQAVTEALKRYEREQMKSEIRVWGYRNVWYRFHPSEANMYIPVSLNMLALQNSAFINSFLSQKDASFPSYEYDGPFCQLAQKIQVEQYQMLKTCLGRSYFYEHNSALIRATRGFVFVKQMGLDEFYRHSREIQMKIENT